MKPEYIGIGNFDTNNYVYAYCNCPLPVDCAIKWPRIKDGKPHSYTCICEGCGAEVGVYSKSFSPEVYRELEMTDVLDKIRAEIEQAADKQFQIAMGVADLNERYTHIQMENAYRHTLNIIDKYKTSPTGAEGGEG